MKKLINFLLIILVTLLAISDSAVSSPAQASVPALPQVANGSASLAPNGGEGYLELAYTAQFQIVWSDMGSGALENAAFWRPVVPQGYYALGHYGQANYSPPSGGMYTARELVPGALAPPATYIWVWGDGGSDGTYDGSFWQPVPQPGYKCLGTLAQFGYTPPSTDAIRCVREDLVSQASVGQRLWDDKLSGADDDFSAWYIDPGADGIGVGAFAGNSSYEKASYPVYVIKSSIVRKSVPSESLELVYVEDYILDWSDQGSGAVFDVAFWNPVIPSGYYSLGDYAQSDYGIPRGPSFAVRELVPGALAQPVDYYAVWTDEGSGADLDGSIWKPIPPFGYVCLGMVAQPNYQKPGLDEIRCVREDLTVPGKINGCFWQSRGLQNMGTYLSVWRVVPALDEAIYTGVFKAYQPARGLELGPDGYYPIFPPADITFALNARAVGLAPSLTAAEVDALIRQYGPYIYMDPAEIFFMDDPAWGLDNTRYRLNYALVPLPPAETDVDLHYVQYLGVLPTTAATLMDDYNYILKNIKPTAPYNGSALFTIWLEFISSGVNGEPNRAKAYIRVVPWNTFFTEIQFWIYYPYNGPGRVEACATGYWCEDQQFAQNGRHYGDWENVSLFFLNQTKTLEAVYLSAHTGGFWIDKDYFGSVLAFENGHPVVNSAFYSHANYPFAGRHYYMRVYSQPYGVGTLSADLYDLTGYGYKFRTDIKYQVISSATFPVNEPAWARFPGRWGQYEYNHDDVTFAGIYIIDYSEIGAGPSGPNMKKAWGISNFGEMVGWPTNSVSVDWRFIYLPKVSR